MTHAFDPKRTALLTIDLQNDFLHPEGAYGRAGQTSDLIAALPDHQIAYVDADHKSADQEAEQGKDPKAALSHGAAMEVELVNDGPVTLIWEDLPDQA